MFYLVVEQTVLVYNIVRGVDNMILTRLRDLREDRNWPQRAIAYELHITQRAYAHYENGTRSVPIEILSALADIYHVSTDYLLDRTDITTPYPMSHKKEDAAKPR